MEFCDSTHPDTLWEAKRDDRIKVIFKHSKIRNIDEFYDNKPIYNAAEHFHMIAKDCPELYDDPYDGYKNRTVTYDKDDIELMKKIVHIGQPQLYQYDFWGPKVKIFKSLIETSTDDSVLNTDRKYDFVFCGTIDYFGYPFCSFIRAHRTKIFNNLKKLEKYYNCLVLDEKGRMPTLDFYKLLRDTKVSISPYGMGAICYRDFESIMCGNEIVSPDKSWVYTQPDIYNNDNAAFTLLENCYDIDVLKNSIDEALSKFNDKSRIQTRFNNYKMIKDAYYKTDYIDHMCSVIKQAMNK